MSELTGCVGADAASISALIQRMREAGVKRLFLKELSRNEDNRRQIYLPDGLIQIFKATLLPGNISTSTQKVKSKPGTPIPTARVQWTWLGDGPRSPAPETKLILYSHPETRLSGFISGSPNPPDALREHLKGNYGERWLLFGQAGEETLGAVAAAPLGERVDLPIPLAEVSNLSDKLFHIDLVAEQDYEQQLRTLLGKSHPCVILKAEGALPIPFRGNQGAGYTLEALMGVPANARTGPDIGPFELKAFHYSYYASLMTPEADGGLKKELGAAEFIRRYGQPGIKNPASMHYTGAQYVGKVSEKGRLLKMNGDPKRPERTDSIESIEVKSGVLLERWSSQSFSQKWVDKANVAFFVCGKRDAATNTVLFTEYFRCEGTSPSRLLSLLAEGNIKYDPGHALSPTGKAKPRSQWRISTAKNRFSELLKELYQSVEHYCP